MAGVPMFTRGLGLASAPTRSPTCSAACCSCCCAAARRPQLRPVAHWARCSALALVTKLALAIFVPLALWRCSVAPRAARRAACSAPPRSLPLPWLSTRSPRTAGPIRWPRTRHAAGRARSAALSRAEPRSTSWTFLTVTLPQLLGPVRLDGASSRPTGCTWSGACLSLLALARPGLRAAPGCAIRRWQLLVATRRLRRCSAYVGYNLAFEQFQGRYLFTALVPIGVPAGRRLGGLAPSPVQASLGALGHRGVVLVALNAYALVRVLVPGFAPSG